MFHDEHPAIIRPFGFVGTRGWPVNPELTSYDNIDRSEVSPPSWICHEKGTGAFKYEVDWRSSFRFRSGPLNAKRSFLDLISRESEVPPFLHG